MKLSGEQIQQVEYYLTKKGLKYIDIRYEVLDHMVTDIEQLMESKNLSFLNASENVFTKWNENFVTRSSFWIGLVYSGPKIFIDNSVIIYKKMVLKIQLIAFVVIIGFGNFSNYFKVLQSDYSQEITLLFKIIAVFSMVIVLYWFYQIKKTKLQTSYSFLFTRNALPSALVFGTLGLLFSESNSMILAFIIFGLWSGWVLFKHHVKSVSNYSLPAKS